MRDDLSNKLIHLTKGTGKDKFKHREEAFEALFKILEQKQLIGGTGCIKGEHKCVCFSEAPISKLSHLLAKNDSKVYKYQPYGIIFEKDYIFVKGGRPVIYQPESDYYVLDPRIQYRHVTFDLNNTPPIDFTWEREWRLQVDYLPLDPKLVTVVVPNRFVKDELEARFQSDKWHFIVLCDLGVNIDPV